jgi:hypothetical protein
MRDWRHVWPRAGNRSDEAHHKIGTAIVVARDDEGRPLIATTAKIARFPVNSARLRIQSAACWSVSVGGLLIP